MTPPLGPDPLRPLGWIRVDVRGQPVPRTGFYLSLSAAAENCPRGQAPLALWSLTPNERTYRRGLFAAGLEAEI